MAGAVITGLSFKLPDFDRLRTYQNSNAAAVLTTFSLQVAQWRCHHAVVDNAAMFVHLPEKVDHERLGRIAVKVCRSSRLHDLSVSHQCDPICHEHGFLRVMSNQKSGRVQLFQHMQCIVPNLVAQPGVEAGEWFVQQHDPWRRSKGPGQGYPLLLTT